MDIFTEFLAFDEELNEVAQALDDVVVHLLPPPHNQVLPQQGHAQAPLPHLLYNSESEPDSDNEMDPDLPWREVQDIPSFWLMNIMSIPPQQPTESNSLSLYRLLLLLLILLTTIIGMDCKVTKSVVCHPVDWIYNSISLWIITTAIDFNPYKDALFSITQYALKVKQSLICYSDCFHSSDPRYSFLLNMTIDDIDSVLHEITSTQIEAFNLTDHIHKLKDIRTKRLLPFGGLFNFLFGTANDDDVRSMKQDVQKLYDNQISQLKVLSDFIPIANISRGIINANIMKIKQIISTISFLNNTMDSIRNQLKPLFTAGRFLLLHMESLIHHSRIRSLIGQM